MAGTLGSAKPSRLASRSVTSRFWNFAHFEITPGRLSPHLQKNRSAVNVSKLQQAQSETLHTMETQTQTTAAVPQKFTRYRSVRNAASKTVSAPPPPVPQPAESGIKRVASRYRSNRPDRTGTVGAQSQRPEDAQSANKQPERRTQDFKPQIPVQGHRDFAQTAPWSQQELYDSTQPAGSSPDAGTTHAISGALGKDDRIIHEKVAERKHAKQDKPESDLQSASLDSLDQAQREAYAILNGERDLSRRRASREQRSERPKVVRNISDEPRGQENTKRSGRASAQNRNNHGKRDEKIKSHQRAGVEALASPIQTTPLRQGSQREDPVTVLRSVPVAITSSSIPVPRKTSDSFPTLTNKDKSSKPEPTVHPGAGPGIDAPISAVNAGERRVLVKCREQSIYLPVIPSTTAVDIMCSAAKVLSENIDTKNSMLMESFKQLNLERPLRHYEHIRDILNSWDRDDQNHLAIVPLPTGTNDDELNIGKVPAKQPSDFSVHIHHSQRPGSWDKRYITLRADGQMLLAKQQGGETKNICHMSDFDIYIPTDRRKKQLKPPRKICFAVKSQQKSAMFLSTVNFVHFFSTKNQSVGGPWYKAVQEWRSWYLVHTMGLGQPSQTYTSPFSQLTPQHQRHASDATFTHQHIGSFKSRNAEQMFNRSSAADTRQRSSLPSQGNAMTRPIKPPTTTSPPISFPRKLTKNATTHVPTTRARGPSLVQSQRISPPPDPFAATGLLGRTYTQRRRTHHSGASNPNPNPTPTSPPSKPPTYTNYSSSPPHKTSSPRPPVKPLIDLQPQYQEPPQHARKGRGLIPSHLPPGGLIDIATSPEVAIPIPSATAWRKPPPPPPAATASENHGVAVAAVQRTLTMRSRAPTLSSRPAHAVAGAGEPVEPFTAGGLLALAAEGQGGRMQGKGVRCGDREAREPMIEVQRERQYVPGSLLAGMAQRGGE